MIPVDKAIEAKRAYDIILTNYVKDLIERSDKSKLVEFAQMRNFPLGIVETSDIFYVRTMTEMLLPDYMDVIKTLGIISETNGMPIFNNRFIMPIKNVDGTIQNLVGYSKEANERYIYGTAKYYRRRETMYGLENLELAYNLGYAIITEGITDTMRVRSLGYPNTFAMCGTHKSDYIMKILNRCRHGIIKVHDRDDAGLRALKGWECNRSITLTVGLQYKDVDEMCKEGQENQEWFKENLEACIKWILSATHNGRKCNCEKTTAM